MIHLTGIPEQLPKKNRVLIMGKFDGVHRGHELLLFAMQREQKKGLSAAVLSFTFPDRSDCLSTEEEKAELFRKCGVDLFITCPFTEELRHMPAEAFLKLLSEQLFVRCIVAGTDVSFGFERQGDADFLREMEQRFGYYSVIVEKQKENGRDISSTWIREELKEGRIEEANLLLGYDYFLSGEVVHGRGIGKTRFQSPTLNLIPQKNKCLPPFGVYLTETRLDGKFYQGISNLGVKPTVSDTEEVGLETHLLDFSGNVYGEMVTTSFLSRIRPEMRFPSAEELKAQIDRDTAFARHYFSL